MRSVVLGAGAVGRLFAGLLGSAGPVRLLDVAGDAERADATAPDPALDRLLSTTDVAVLALPEPVLPAAVERVAAALPAGALLAQTASVQTRVAAVQAAAADRHRLEAAGLDPMFAPALGFAGRPVALVEVRPGYRTAGLERLLTGTGAHPVRLSPARHDALTGAAQVATHAAVLAFGLALRELAVPAGELVAIAPPPHRTLLALLARLAAGNPEVYREIQHAHPAGPAVRAALAAGVERVGSARGEAEFAALMADLRAVLGPELDPLADRCAALFAAP